MRQIAICAAALPTSLSLVIIGVVVAGICAAPFRGYLKYLRPTASTILKNIRHERFALGIVKGLTQDAAYEEAGYKPNRGNAGALNAKQHIQERIAELMARAAERVEITVASLTQQLIEDREFARSLDSPSAAAQASGLLMKLNGLGSEKLKVETQSVVDYLADMSRADIPVEAIEASDEGDSVH